MSQLSTSSGDFDISGYNSHFELPRPSNDLEPSSPTYPSLTTRKSVAPAEHPLHNGDGWPYLSMSLDDTGLLYCKSISMDMLGSVNPGTHSDIFPLPTSEDAIDSMTAQQKEVRFGNKLSHIETSEAEFVAQLEHLRDFYMQPLLGQKPVRRSIRKRVFSFDQLTALFQRGNSSTTATSCEVQRSRSCNSHPTQLPNEEQYDNSQRSTGICSMLKGLSRPLNRNHDFKLDHKATYQPTAQNEAIVSAPFDHVTSLIELHHSFHMALKKARPADMLIHVLVGIFVDHIPRLHTHFAHANALSASLSNFETLVFNDEKLARIIKMRDQTSFRENLRSLLISIPAARIWYYGSVLQAMYVRMAQSLDDILLHQLEWCLDNLESIARRMWPVLMQIGHVQRTALLQRNIVGIKESVLSPYQRIIHMDMIQSRVFGQPEEWQTLFAVLLTDRLLLLKETGRRKNRIVLKTSICLKDASLLPAQKILDKSVNGFFVRRSHSGCMQLRMANEQSFKKWCQMFKITGSLRHFPPEPSSF